MDDLIKALQIFQKYRDESRPTICDHDILIITSITEDEISHEDRKNLNDLGFDWDENEEYWYSFKFGSA